MAHCIPGTAWRRVEAGEVGLGARLSDGGVGSVETATPAGWPVEGQCRADRTDASGPEEAVWQAEGSRRAHRAPEDDGEAGSSHPEQEGVEETVRSHPAAAEAVKASVGGSVLGPASALQPARVCLEAASQSLHSEIL